MEGVQRICVQLEEVKALLERQLHLQAQLLQSQTEIEPALPIDAPSIRVMPPSQRPASLRMTPAEANRQAETSGPDDMLHPHVVPNSPPSNSDPPCLKVAASLEELVRSAVSTQSVDDGRASHTSGSQWLQLLKPARPTLKPALSRRFSFEHFESLEHVPWPVRMMLVMACTFPSYLCTKRLQRVYCVFKWAMGLSVVNEVLRSCCLAYLYAKCLGKGLNENMYIWFCFFYLAAALPLHRTMTRQFRDGGEMPAFMEQMTVQGFNWACLHPFIFLCNIIGVMFVVGTKSITILQMMSGSLIRQQCVGTAPVVSKLLHAVEFPSFLSLPLAVMGMTATVFHAVVFSKLHAYDLLCYSGALAKTFEENDEDPLPLLKEVESLIGERFRRASETWVVAAIRSIVIVGMICIIIMFQLLEGPTSSSTAAWLLILLVLLLFMGLLGVPMARVSEVFEYDVLKALNTPLVIKHAQRHFGQQLLPHLHSLDWGFRVGGTVINMRLAMTVLLTAVASTVVTVSRTATEVLS